MTPFDCFTLEMVMVDSPALPSTRMILSLHLGGAGAPGEDRIKLDVNYKVGFISRPFILWDMR